MRIDIEAEERVQRLLSLEPTTAADFSEIERVLLNEIERALAEKRILHSIKLKQRLWELRGRKSIL